MKTMSLILLFAVLAFVLLITFLVKKEQRSMSRLSNNLIKLARKFDSWQMMR
jgi:flagellar biogenesis protein FliO